MLGWWQLDGKVAFVVNSEPRDWRSPLSPSLVPLFPQIPEVGTPPCEDLISRVSGPTADSRSTSNDFQSGCGVWSTTNTGDLIPLQTDRDGLAANHASIDCAGSVIYFPTRKD